MSNAVHADQFKQSFREEAREILVDLEAALLELNENRERLELVGRVFRALHTIKGSGAMFGFEDLATFTHNLENAFDEVRNGRLEISSELIDLTLSALDQIRAMLEEGAGGAPLADAGVCAEILVQGAASDGQAGGQPCRGKLRRPSPHLRSPPRIGCVSGSSTLLPAPELMRCGANPLLLLRELRQLGGLSVRASWRPFRPLPNWTRSAAM